VVRAHTGAHRGGNIRVGRLMGPAARRESGSSRHNGSRRSRLRRATCQCRCRICASRECDDARPAVSRALAHQGKRRLDGASPVRRTL
jgi:hypothetical protein